MTTAPWLSAVEAVRPLYRELLAEERRHTSARAAVAASSALLARTPLARTGTVEEIAEAVRWLLVDATYATGQVIRIDGGRSLPS